MEQSRESQVLLWEVVWSLHTLEHTRRMMMHSCPALLRDQGVISSPHLSSKLFPSLNVIEFLSLGNRRSCVWAKALDWEEREKWVRVNSLKSEKKMYCL